MNDTRGLCEVSGKMANDHACQKRKARPPKWLTTGKVKFTREDKQSAEEMTVLWRSRP
jgi:hypothetical protein